MNWKLVLLLIVLPGCYSEKTAQKQFSRAIVAYPGIAADYCGRNYPVKIQTVKGDSTIIRDTTFLPGYSTADSFVIHDTLVIVQTRILPSKIITNTIHLTDTLYQENRAALDACEIEKTNLANLLSKKTFESDSFKSKASKRGIILWSLIGLIIAIIGMNIYLKAKKITL